MSLGSAPYFNTHPETQGNPWNGSGSDLELGAGGLLTFHRDGPRLTRFCCFPSRWIWAGCF